MKKDDGIAGFAWWVVAFVIFKVCVLPMLGRLTPKPPPQPQVDQAERVMREGVRSPAARG
jgi:hypothetical protein